MMASIPGLLVRIGVFAMAMALVLFVVFRTIDRPLSVETDDYSAIFTDANGLREGDDIREFGVAVGKVTSVRLAGTQARVDFTLDRDRRIAETGKLVIRYQNLTGQRYVDIQNSAHAPDDTANDHGVYRAPGETIPVESTVGSFDVTTLFNGLQPVLAELDPAEVNKFTGSLLAVVEGDGNGLGPAMDAIKQLSDYASDRQDVLSILVRNLSLVSQQIGGKSGNAIALISELTKLFTAIQQKLPNLVSFSYMIPPLLDPLDDMLARLGLIGDPNQPLDELINRAFPEPAKAIETLNKVPGFLQSLTALIPDTQRHTCTHGPAPTPKEISVFLAGQRITVCRAG